MAALVKLHGLLAVLESVTGQANKCHQELVSTFKNKAHHFSEQIKTFKSIEENVTPKQEEIREIQTSVGEEVDWLSKKIVSFIDVGHQIDEANMVARADVVVGDVTLLKDVPTTSLLRLEHRIGEIQKLVTSIPTLDPAKGFKLDTNKGAGFWKARDVEKERTKKTREPLVLAPATDKHPAQVQLIDKDVVTGTILEQEWSSLITTATKADILDRCEELMKAIQKARAKANEVEVDPATHKVGGKIWDFIFKPLKDSLKQAA